MKQILSTIILLLCILCGWAQEAADSTASKKKAKRELQVLMMVKDHITHDGIDSTLTAQLINAADSSFVDSVHIEVDEWEGKRYVEIIAKVKEAGNYLIRLNADGYATKYVSVDVSKMYKREQFRQMKTVYMRRLPKRDERTLDELVVTATKLKFYMDGDTLVYDADAFNLAEGSMLDGLLKKLPGVELKPGGEIMVNGRKVEALLLNGKDFFDKDRELILENMPAFMVKNVQSYERVNPLIKGTPQESTTPKELVMNVKLKRDYNSGWITTAEAGAGPTFFRKDDGKLDTKYLGRLFALRFSDKSRFTMFANVNNLTDDRKPGEKGEWSPLTQSTGLMQTSKLGANYQYGDWEDLRYEGDASVAYYDKDNAEHEARETFLNGGNTFGRSFHSKRSYDVQVESRHELYKNFEELSWAKNFRIHLAPSFDYLKWNNHEESASATFAEDVASNLGKAWMDSIANPMGGELLLRYAINRTLSNKKGIGHWVDIAPGLSINMSPPHNDYLAFYLSASYRYTDLCEDNYEHYRLNSYKAGTSDFRNRYNPTFDRTHNFTVKPSIFMTFDSKRHHSLQVEHHYAYNRERHRNSLYLLNKLDEWGDSTRHSIGTLPSMDEMLRTLDADNSTRTGNLSHKNVPQLTYRYARSNDDASYVISANIAMPITKERLEYWQGAQADTTFWRTTTFLHPHLNFYHSDWKRGRSIHASLSMTMSAPSMTSLLNITNTADPLYITHSNPNLKNTQAFHFYGGYRDKFGRTLFHVNADAEVRRNAVASGFIYNRETGVRTVTPDNVNGNWNAYIAPGVDVPLTKDDKWRIKNELSYSFNNSVDLSGTGESMVATRSVVKTNDVKENLDLVFRPNDKLEFTASGKLTYQNSTSERKDFQTINAFDFNYGLSAVLELPWDLQVSTDVTMYSRRGYSDSSMNTNEFVWNARLSKRLMKGKLSVMFDAFDMLGNLSNVRRYVNAQGKTETFYNVIPSYGLLHVVWRFNGKKNGSR